MFWKNLTWQNAKMYLNCKTDVSIYAKGDTNFGKYDKTVYSVFAKINSLMYSFSNLNTY